MNITEILALPLEKLEEIVEIKRRLVALEGSTPTASVAPAPTSVVHRKLPTAKAAPVKRKVSDETREKIRAAAKERWAKRKS